MANTKPWQARVVQDMFIGTDCVRGISPIEARDAEIAELRAALAITRDVIGVLRHYPDFDDGNNAYSKMMAQALAGETPELLTALDALTAGRKPPVAPVPQQAAGDARPMVPDGWKPVPIIPTQAMMDAWNQSGADDFKIPDVEVSEYTAEEWAQWVRHNASIDWAAMLAAAPSPPSEGEPQ